MALPPVRPRTFEEVFNIFHRYPEAHLFKGYGSKIQYHDLDAGVDGLGGWLGDVQKRCGNKPLTSQSSSWNNMHISVPRSTRLLGLPSHKTEAPDGAAVCPPTLMPPAARLQQCAALASRTWQRYGQGRHT